MSVRLRWVESGPLLEQALALRERVFCREQGVAREEELDGLDGDARHLVALDGDSVVGTLRLLEQGGSAKIGRVAVEPAHRRRGIGGAMTDAAVEAARGAGCTRAVLASQTYIVELYERAGFTVDSEEFEEAGIPHVSMAREL